MHATTRLICLTLPLLAQLLLTQACVDDHADKKKLKNELAEKDRESANLLQEKAAMEAQKNQLELDAAEDAETMRKNQKKIETLEQSAAMNAKEIESLVKANKDLKARIESREAEIEALKKQLASGEKILAQRNDEIQAKTQDINRLTADLALASSKAETLTKELEAQKTTTATKEKALALLEAQNAELLTGANGEAIKTLNLEIEGLKRDLEAAKTKEKDLHEQVADAQKRSAELNDEIRSIDAALQKLEAQTTGAQVLLMNAGKDLLYVVDSHMIKDTYMTAEGESCALIFNIDRQVNVLRNPNAPMPSITDWTVLPLKGSYQKVAVCRKGEQINAQVEKGSLYQAIHAQRNTSVQLITGRDSSSCEDPATVDHTPFYSRYQVIHPYRGSIDGIETIDLLQSEGKPVRFNMASTTEDFRGSTGCDEVVTEGIASELAVIACKLALGQKTEAQVSQGCFKELSNNEKTELSFQSR